MDLFFFFLRTGSFFNFFLFFLFFLFFYLLGYISKFLEELRKLLLFRRFSFFFNFRFFFSFFLFFFFNLRKGFTTDFTEHKVTFINESTSGANLSENFRFFYFNFFFFRFNFINLKFL